MTRSRGTILIGGALAQVPGNGGLAWFHLQLLLGFRRLGWDVLFLDRLEPGMREDEARCVHWLRSVMQPFGFGESYSLWCDGGARVIGVPREQVMQAASEAELLINVMGYIHDEAILARVRRRVFLDIDPGFGQMWRDLGLHDPFVGHDQFVTLGMNIGKRGCTIPTCGLKWLTMPQPVVLDEWPGAAPQLDRAFTSIGAWRGSNAPVEYKGQTYGQRVHEFRRFVDLPRRCSGVKFEMAFDMHPADQRDISLLHDRGWSLVHPHEVAATPRAYREYIRSSAAEFMIPKHMYVASRSGLLSDRSAYYLASGRPVLARDTGIGELYPVGEGLLTFTNLEEAVAGVEAIRRGYEHHCRAARAIADQHLDSDKVLTRLLSQLEIN
jgi:hypothetical protein